MAAPDDDLARELEALGAEYRASLAQRLSDIDTAWSAVTRGDASALRTLLRGLHSIAGSALTFGLPELSRSAATAEDWIEPYNERQEAPPPAAHAAFDALLAAVRRTASG